VRLKIDDIEEGTHSARECSMRRAGER